MVVVVLITVSIVSLVTLDRCLDRWERERRLRAISKSFVSALTDGDYEAAERHATAWLRTAGQLREPPPPFRWPSVPGGSV